MACGRCGYNLRSLPLSGKCPECGTPVLRTVDGDALWAAPGGWRTTVALGMALLAAGIATWVALQVIWGQGLETARLTKAMLGAGLLLGTCGTILATTPEPDPLRAARGLGRRAVVRWGILAAAALYVASPWLNVRGRLFQPGQVTADALVLGLSSVVIGLLFLFALHVSWLARRAGRAGLCWGWRTVAGAGLAGWLFCVGPTLLKAALGDKVPPTMAGQGISLLLVLVPVIVAMWMVVLLVATAWAVWRPEPRGKNARAA